MKNIYRFITLLLVFIIAMAFSATALAEAAEYVAVLRATNVRENADGTGKSIGKLLKGNILQTPGVTGGAWAAISYEGKTAYVKAADVLAYTINQPKKDSGLRMGSATITKDTAAYRGAGTQYEQAGLLQQGNQITIRYITNDWAAIWYNRDYAFVDTKYLSMKTDVTKEYFEDGSVRATAKEGDISLSLTLSKTVLRKGESITGYAAFAYTGAKKSKLCYMGDMLFVVKGNNGFSLGGLSKLDIEHKTLKKGKPERYEMRFGGVVPNEGDAYYKEIMHAYSTDTLMLPPGVYNVYVYTNFDLEQLDEPLRYSIQAPITVTVLAG